MEYEIELKLLTNENAGEVIKKDLLPKLNAKVTQESQILTNHYFDTAERILRQHRIGLRIRGHDQKFEQTLKTAGESIGGLHQRPEYNVQLDVSKQHNITLPDLRLFPASAWPSTLNLELLQTKINTLFTTHFKRDIYLLEFMDGDIIELVWDLGEVKSGDKSVGICEMELELKKGKTTALFDLAKQIVRLMPTTIGIDSKAARGYQLLDDAAANEFSKVSQTIPDNIEPTAEVYARLLTTQLQAFQGLSVEVHRCYSQQAINRIKDALEGLANISNEFARYAPSHIMDNIQARLTSFCHDWSSILQQGDKNASLSLLNSAKLTQLQLDITQYLVEQSWSINGA